MFCDYVKKEVRRLHHMFPEKLMEPLTSEEWKGYNRASVIFALSSLENFTPRSGIIAITLANTEDLPTGTAI